MQGFQEMSFASTVAVGGISLLFYLLIRGFTSNRWGRSSQLPLPPVVPGLPLIGNLLQLKEKKPYRTFANWAEIYGPIYSIRTGASTVIVLNSADVAKEAMVTRFSSISTRKLSNALKILTSDKRMVAMSDYNDFHKMTKRHIITYILGANAQKRHRHLKDTLIENILSQLHANVKSSPLQAVNFRNIFESELFGLALKQENNCYLEYLLSEAKTLTEQEIAMLIWEIIIETADTTLVTAEWAMYELAKDQNRQDHLYKEIQNVCGSNKIMEENLSQLPYLGAVFHETLRKHSPAVMIPLRYAHEDTQLGGYHIPAGTEIAINIYGCNMDKNKWEKPDEWKPERFLEEKYDPMDLYKTMAFGSGKRICAGSLQAMSIACTAIGRFVQEFEWRLKDGEEENVDYDAFTTRKLHPVQAILKPRDP